MGCPLTRSCGAGWCAFPNGGVSLAGSPSVRTLSSELTPTAGAVTFRGIPIHGLPPHEIVRRGVVCVPQRRRIFGGLTVRENLELGAYSHRRERQAFRQNLEMVLRLFPHLGTRLGQLSGTLSGGEQQMSAIGRALMSHPQLLLIDELSLGLSPLLVDNLMEAIGQVHRRGTSILLVEQDVQIALEHAHRGYVLEIGRITLSGKSKDLLENPEVRRSYLGI